MEQLTRRQYLCGRRGSKTKKLLDMEEVYRELDSGMKLAEVAAKHGVSVMTLRRRHKEHQDMVEALQEKNNSVIQGPEDYKLPPLPENFGAL